ncbi:hypothetical protein WAI453_008152 [Rhynchosporium graminicola]
MPAIVPVSWMRLSRHEQDPAAVLLVTTSPVVGKGVVRGSSTHGWTSFITSNGRKVMFFTGVKNQVSPFTFGRKYENGVRT